MPLLKDKQLTFILQPLTSYISGWSSTSLEETTQKQITENLGSIESTTEPSKSKLLLKVRSPDDKPDTSCSHGHQPMKVEYNYLRVTTRLDMCPCDVVTVFNSNLNLRQIQILIQCSEFSAHTHTHTHRGYAVMMFWMVGLCQVCVC